MAETGGLRAGQGGLFRWGLVCRARPWWSLLNRTINLRKYKTMIKCEKQSVFELESSHTVIIDTFPRCFDQSTVGF